MSQLTSRRIQAPAQRGRRSGGYGGSTAFAGTPLGGFLQMIGLQKNPYDIAQQDEAERRKWEEKQAKLAFQRQIELLRTQKELEAQFQNAKMQIENNNAAQNRVRDFENSRAAAIANADLARNASKNALIDQAQQERINNEYLAARSGIPVERFDAAKALRMLRGEPMNVQAGGAVVYPNAAPGYGGNIFNRPAQSGGYDQSTMQVVPPVPGGVENFFTTTPEEKARLTGALAAGQGNIHPENRNVDVPAVPLPIMDGIDAAFNGMPFGTPDPVPQTAQPVNPPAGGGVINFNVQDPFASSDPNLINFSTQNTDNGLIPGSGMNPQESMFDRARRMQELMQKVKRLGIL